MRARRPMNPQAAKDRAAQEARYMEMYDEADIKAVEDAIMRRGEFYNMDKYPDPRVVAIARDQYDARQAGTPEMRLLGDDRRRFYGIDPRVSGNPQPVIAVQPKPENIAVVPAPGYEQSAPGVLRKAGDKVVENVERVKEVSPQLLQQALMLLRNSPRSQGALAALSGVAGAAGVNELLKPEEEDPRLMIRY